MRLLVSAIHPHESAIGVHMSPRSWPPSHGPPIPPSGLSQSPALSSLSHTGKSHWLSVLHVVPVCLCAALSVRPAPPAPGTASLFSAHCHRQLGSYSLLCQGSPVLVSVQSDRQNQMILSPGYFPKEN